MFILLPTSTPPPKFVPLRKMLIDEKTLLILSLGIRTVEALDFGWKCVPLNTHTDKIPPHTHPISRYAETSPKPIKKKDKNHKHKKKREDK